MANRWKDSAITGVCPTLLGSDSFAEKRFRSCDSEGRVLDRCTNCRSIVDDEYANSRNNALRLLTKMSDFAKNRRL
jgi:hypothetical protein